MVVDTHKVDVTVKKTTNTGILKIELSEEVLVLSSIKQWNNSNDGLKNLRIEYLPNDKSLELFEDMKINMQLKWYVVEIEEVSNKRRRM